MRFHLPRGMEGVRHWRVGPREQGEGPTLVSSSSSRLCSLVEQSEDRGRKRRWGRPAPVASGQTERTGGLARMQRLRSEEKRLPGRRVEEGRSWRREAPGASGGGGSRRCGLSGDERRRWGGW